MNINDDEAHYLLEQIMSINSFVDMSVKHEDDGIVIKGDLFPSAFIYSLNEILNEKYVYIIKPDNNMCYIKIFRKLTR